MSKEQSQKQKFQEGQDIYIPIYIFLGLIKTHFVVTNWSSEGNTLESSLKFIIDIIIICKNTNTETYFSKW